MFHAIRLGALGSLILASLGAAQTSHLAGATLLLHGGMVGTGVPISSGPPIVFGAPFGTVVTDQRTGDWDLLQFGTGSFMGSLGAAGSATRSYVDFPSSPDSESNYRSEGSLFADVTIRNNTFQAARLAVEATNEPNNLTTSGASPKFGYLPSTRLQLELAGSTVFDQTIAQTSFSYGWSLNLGPYDTPTVYWGYNLWVSSFHAEAQAGVSASAGLLATANLASVSLALEGQASAECHGHASVSFSALFGLVSAKLTGELDFGGPSFELEAGAGVFTGAGGFIEICCRPIDLILDLYGKICWFKKCKSNTWNLVNYHRAETCTTITF